MNEYARLARLKHVTARSYPELLAACFGLDETKARISAAKLEAAPSYEATESKLPLRPAAAQRLIELLRELRRRRATVAVKIAGAVKKNEWKPPLKKLALSQ